MSAFNSNVDRLGHTCPRTYKTEAVVVGAGVVGLAIARALALRGIEVFVIEIAGGIGYGTSSRNSEVIHAGLYYKPGSLISAWTAVVPSINIATRSACPTNDAASS